MIFGARAGDLLDWAHIAASPAASILYMTCVGPIVGYNDVVYGFCTSSQGEEIVGSNVPWWSS